MDGVTPELPARRMTADEFIVWSQAQPRGRFELEDGEVIAMASERARHARVKAAVWVTLRDAIRHSGLTCEAFPDGMAVRVDDRTVYEPDALVRCGAKLPDDAVILNDPVIVVEVTSPSTAWRDESDKLFGYLLMPSVRHYLIINPDKNIIIQTSRPDDGADAITRIVTSGLLRLDPPGLELDVAALFGDA